MKICPKSPRFTVRKLLLMCADVVHFKGRTASANHTSPTERVQIGEEEVQQQSTQSEAFGLHVTVSVST